MARSGRRCFKMASYKARGIVLHTIKYGDTSMVAHVLTDVYGRRSFLVQGIRSRKGKGNKAAMLQPMFLLEFEGIPSVHSQMDRMKDVVLRPPMHTIPFDVRKSAISLFMAEVLYRLTRDADPNPDLFSFISSSVEALDRMESGVANFHLWFLVQLSAFLGFYPANEYSEGDYFDIVEGAFVGSRPDHAVVVNRPNTTLLAELMSCSSRELGQISLSHGQRADFLTSLLDYFDYHLDNASRIQSVRILGEMF